MPGYDYISFTTDYGLSDGFVAACHGMIARGAPEARILDVTHLIAPGDITRGAAVLAQTVPYLPDAVHLAVVDPGVGTVRRPVLLRTERGLLVGPDNGLLVWAATALGGIAAAYELASEEWFAPNVSRTFHGRDVFAPVAARLARGADPADVGPELGLDDLVRLPDPVVALGDGWLEAEVLTVDRFGNVQLAAAGAALEQLPDRLTVGGCRAIRGTTFADAPSGGLVVFADSADRVAIAVNGGRAAVILAVTPGDMVRIS
ncbi:SAM-dependent chlorinase/fluorinase [Catellatospora sp. NPDC049609]|uniref:SAM hydrolase/SAM-dependent halogenase family protein n=1 Tax=Catellatospora sp. NPDC049609 TaxID=3155505 RepID=UPI0034152313